MNSSKDGCNNKTKLKFKSDTLKSVKYTLKSNENRIEEQSTNC